MKEYSSTSSRDGQEIVSILGHIIMVGIKKALPV